MLIIIFEFYNDNIRLLVMLWIACQKKRKKEKRKKKRKALHTLSSDIVVDAEIEIFAVAHLIV